MIGHYMNSQTMLANMIEQARYYQVPIGNLPADAPLYASDLFYARHLYKNNYVLWSSPNSLPDLGGKQYDDYRSLFFSIWALFYIVLFMLMFFFLGWFKIRVKMETRLLFKWTTLGSIRTFVLIWKLLVCRLAHFCSWLRSMSLMVNYIYFLDLNILIVYIFCIFRCIGG